MKNKILYRSEKNAMLGGVCAGLADYFSIDVSIVRIIFVLLTLFVSGSGLIVYIILWIVLPVESQVKKESKDKKEETKTIA